MDDRNDYRLGAESPVMVLELAVTTWCNYRCAYCVTEIHPLRRASSHAFDSHPVEAWTGAFGRLRHDFSLLCRGGEPFLDHDGFGRFLTALGALPRLRYLRVDTNGSWSPDRYAQVPPEVRRRVQLNVSFHPTQIKAEQFKARLARILEAGWQVGMVNYVMEAAQAGDYEAIRDELAREHGVYVNPNPDAFDPAWTDLRPSVLREGRRRIEHLLPATDLLRKTGARTLGKSCYYPSISYLIGPGGVAERSCGVLAPGDERRLDFIHHPELLRPLAAPVRCPQMSCLCLDRYAFLEELPHRGRRIDLLDEYVRECRAHQASASAGAPAQVVGR
jgi:hypothetical protein